MSVQQKRANGKSLKNNEIITSPPLLQQGGFPDRSRDPLPAEARENSRLPS